MKITTTNFTDNLKVEKNKLLSLDKEIKHIDEKIAFLALGDSSGLFTGSLIKP